MPQIVLWVPLPPSANNMWARTRYGMRLTERYRKWREEAGEIVSKLKPQDVLDGPVAIDLLVYRGKGWSKRKRDLDNFIKPTIDFLVVQNYLPDDNADIVRAITILIAPNPDKAAGIWIRIKPHNYGDGNGSHI